MTNPRDEFSLYTIFFNPRDYPGQYVARRFNLEAPSEDCCVTDSLENARTWVREFSLSRGRLADWCQPRSPNDEPHILEIWI